MPRLETLVVLLLVTSCGDTTTATTVGASGTVVSTSSSSQTTQSGSSTAQTTSPGETLAATTEHETTTSSEPPPDLPQPICQKNIYSSCTYPVPCEHHGYMCGEPESFWQEDGCMRPVCETLEDCEPGFYCGTRNTHFDLWHCSQYERTPGEFVCTCGGDPVAGDFKVKLCFPVTNN